MCVCVCASVCVYMCVCSCLYVSKGIKKGECALVIAGTSQQSSLPFIWNTVYMRVGIKQLPKTFRITTALCASFRNNQPYAHPSGQTAPSASFRTNSPMCNQPYVQPALCATSPTCNQPYVQPALRATSPLCTSDEQQILCSATICKHSLIGHAQTQAHTHTPVPPCAVHADWK